MTTDARSPSDAHAATIRAGGISLIVAAIAFLGVFSYLAARFNYPDVLDGRAADVLPALLATGDAGRAVWAIYALLPLFWIPAAVGAFHALRARSEGAMRSAMLFAVVSSIAMILGLMRWPSFHWELARTWAAEPSSRPALEAVFNATNSYLGNYIGEFLGELCISVFFLLSSLAMLERDSGFPRWVGWLGVVTGIAGLIGMFRNVTVAVAAIAELNNYLLPLWMIVFGFSLLRRLRHADVQ
ncbi:MAG TPA: DUF4386 family protein [Thermoanaerobaculia bacterium]|jgi:hypothetical protein|nr:DUF4386 family protein [Thermoanaerobaculia bacterium]